MFENFEDHLRLARKIAKAMDSQFSIFGIKFGFDSIIGLLPGVGDFITLAFSFYIFWVGVKLELPKPTLAKMLFNMGVDTVIGTIPVIGDFGDIFFKANLRNLDLIEEYLASQKGVVLDN
jgi:hypothetical protein